MDIKQWCSANKLDVQINSNICTLNNQKFLILNRKEDELIFDTDFHLLLTDQEQSILTQVDIEYVVFQFGDNWYYSSLLNDFQLIPFKYIGKDRDLMQDINFPFLGVHGEYELCNGSRLYSEWCKKAKFLNTTSLGICEKNTLAGTLAFQQACVSAGIKPILGETVVVKDGDDTYQVKLFVENEKGWRNLLNINAQIKVFNGGYVDESYLLEKSEGLICVFSCTDRILKHRYDRYKKVFISKLYQQLDFVEWLAPDKERNHLETLKYNINNYIDIIKPVIICDAYYLDQSDSPIKSILNTIGKIDFQNASKDQFLKSLDDVMQQAFPLFKSEVQYETIISLCLEHLEEINTTCTFQIKLGEMYLPKYEMSKEEKERFETNEDLFFHLIEIGLQTIGKSEDEEYLTRVETEIEVIKLGGFIDYFLILWDIISWCKKNDILTGTGRGSAVGSIISYLLDITLLDPIKYNLLFERFLNAGRIGKSMPDIDTDFASDRRDEVKRYIENRYGINYVTSIGTYGTFKIKSGIKDIARTLGYDAKMTNFITSIIDDNLTFTDFFKEAATNNALKDFVQKYPEIFENYPLLKDQVKNSSIHAAGVIIVPKEYNGQPMDIYDWLPVKKIDGILVTEWEGPVLETAGYLKEDILGTKQLQKLHSICKLVKENKSIDIKLNDKVRLQEIPLDDNEVYNLFRGGWNEDVFQFGAAGLKGYCRELRPDNIEDLIATVALYRPGPMESGAHKTYIKIKNGERQPEYDYMLEEVTKNTHSMYIYQESVMQAMQILGGFNLVEADNIRKAMGKKIASEMEKYKEQFLKNAVEKKCGEYEAIQIWNKLEAFASYGFNRCISGDEKFYKVGNNKSGTSTFYPTIKEMYQIKNDYQYAKLTNHKSLHQRYKYKGYGISFSLNNENRLVKNKIKDIRFVGYKPIYRVLLEDGKTIDVTMNHKFPTSNGERMLQDIDIEKDLLFINIGFIQYDSSHRFGCDSNHNYPSKGTQGFQRKDSNYTKWRELKNENRKITHCENLTCKKLSNRIEMHHKDGNHSNNSIDNIINLCVSCHKKVEYQLGRKKMGEAGLHTSLKKINSIIFLKTDEVFDVEMEAPFHTFTTTNGIVTSNSHAAAYAHTGYYCQWLKFHYPLEFWSVALNFANQDEIPKRIAEMHKVSEIKVLPPDINKSTNSFEADKETGEIFWSIGSIKFIGEKVLDAIIEDRKKGGKFFTFDEFYKRIPKRAVNKRCVTNLILAGCFDQIEKIKTPKDRITLLTYFIKDVCGDVLPDDIKDSNNNWKDYFWILKQKDLTGFGYLNFQNIYNSYIGPNIGHEQNRFTYIDESLFQDEKSIGYDRSVVGILTNVIERKTKNGDYFAEISLDCNDEVIICLIWAKIWPDWRTIILNSKKKIICITGKVQFDEKFKNQNIVQTTDTSIIYTL